MRVSKQNIFYRFVYENPMTEDWRRTPNLCPFMRRVVAAFMMNTLAAILAAFALSCLVMAPIGWFTPGELWGPAWDVLVIIGTSMWLVGAIFASVWVYIAIEDTYKPVHKATDAICDTKPIKLTYRWCKAVHDKTCPHIDFTD